MAEPLNTIPNWVPNIDNPTILFITENYPKDPDDILNNTYFYRSLNTQINSNGAYNLLNNLCRSFRINGENENEKLNKFLFEIKPKPDNEIKAFLQLLLLGVLNSLK